MGRMLLDNIAAEAAEEKADISIKKAPKEKKKSNKETKNKPPLKPPIKVKEATLQPETNFGPIYSDKSLFGAQASFCENLNECIAAGNGVGTVDRVL